MTEAQRKVMAKTIRKAIVLLDRAGSYNLPPIDNYDRREMNETSGALRYFLQETLKEVAEV